MLFVCHTGLYMEILPWGAWSFSRYADAHQKRCRTGNGFAVEQLVGRRWFVLWEGSGGYPPTRTERRNHITLHGVPRPVARALLHGLLTR